MVDADTTARRLRLIETARARLWLIYDEIECMYGPLRERPANLEFPSVRRGICRRNAEKGAQMITLVAFQYTAYIIRDPGRHAIGHHLCHNINLWSGKMHNRDPQYVQYPSFLGKFRLLLSNSVRQQVIVLIYIFGFKLGEWSSVDEKTAMNCRFDRGPPIDTASGHLLFTYGMITAFY